MQTLTELWTLLNRLNRFSFKVNTDNESVIGWQGEGQGLIKRRASVNSDKFELGAVVETIERGEYAVSADCKVPMHNQYLWQLNGDHIRLTHLRFGWDKPVFLFDIIESEQGALVTRQSHQCVDDNYDASFVLQADSLAMQWRIQGPKKREVLDYIYSV